MESKTKNNGEIYWKMKKITQLEIYKKIRKGWKINPKTKIVPNKKNKTRQQNKKELKQRLKNEKMS